jgi:drug/metabolite transporter (DMT)-like permease
MVLQALVSSIFGMLGLGIIKLGLRSGVTPHLGEGASVLTVLGLALRSPLVLVGMGTGFLSTLNLIHLMCRTDFITATPVVIAIGQIAMVLVAVLVLHEQMTVSRGLGIALVLAGCVLISRGALR